jgi:putative transposase
MSYKATSYRLYPTSTQEALLLEWMNQCRFIWNISLSESIKRYEKEGKFNFVFDMKKRIPLLKKEFPWLNAPSHALQNKCFDLHNAEMKYLKNKDKTGFPAFKSKRNYNSGIEINQVSNHITLFDKSIKIPKMGLVKYRKHREELGKLVSITIKNQSNKWYVVCLFNTGEGISPITDINTADIGGIDVGLKEFLTTDQGIKIDNPRFLKKSLKKLKKIQRQLSKSKKHSKNREKKKLRVALVFEKIKNKRKDFHHKIANAIIKHKLIIVSEDLNIKGMVKNHNLARAISDVSWGNFLNILSYKLIDKGGFLERIGRFFPSSKKCCKCGVIKKDLKLSDRIFDCDSCDNVMDRDENAAINILNEGINQINRAGTVRIYATNPASAGLESKNASGDTETTCATAQVVVSLKEEAPIPLGSE